MFYYPRISFIAGVSFIAFVESVFCLIIFSVYSLAKYLTSPEGRQRRALTDASDSSAADDDSSEVCAQRVPLYVLV